MGLVDKIKGIAKETAGKAAGDKDLERAGTEQQKRGQKQEEATNLEEQAEQKRNQAAGHKGEQMKRED